MQVPQRSRYALRALFELSKHFGQGPVKISEVAAAQAIPLRFLEAILNQVKQGGFVESKRGSDGGYFMVRQPETLTLGEILRFMDGSVGPASCEPGASEQNCPLFPDCVFRSVWEKATKAVAGVYDNTTFGDLVLDYARKSGKYVPQFTI